MNAHVQTYVRVNAAVDVGAAGIVAALSDFPLLETIESCQGPPAWVCFRYGDPKRGSWRELAEFVFDRLGPALVESVGTGANVRVQMTGSGIIMGELSVQEGQTDAVERCLRELCRSYRAPRP